MSDFGSLVAHAVMGTNSPSVQFRGAVPVNPSDDAHFARQTEQTDLCADDELQAFMALIAASPAVPLDRAGGVIGADGATMHIPLVNKPGTWALIDAEDYPLVMRYRWRLDYFGRYAVATVTKSIARMHRLIMMVGPSLEVDHKSRETLDNRKCNLRACTHAENMWNMCRSARNSTGVKGVVQRGERFMATVTARKVMSVEWFDSMQAASDWVTAKRAELHGEFARHA